jgi:hypothetical protein
MALGAVTTGVLCPALIPNGKRALFNSHAATGSIEKPYVNIMMEFKMFVNTQAEQYSPFPV